MNTARILIVDDEPAMLDNCSRLLTHEGYECRTLGEPRQFAAVCGETDPDLVLVDLRMPGMGGMEVLAQSLANDPSRPVIIMTGFATVESAVQAIRQGAFDYIAKPFSGDQLSVTVARGLAFRGLTLENRRLRRHVARPSALDGMLGVSPEMTRLADELTRIAASNADVLVTGESGTGKELVARAIHSLSARSRASLMPIDCASLPGPLLESELFGHEKGAFTGAVARKKGLLVEAHGGTVFLDEITELGPTLQSKLLRALEERKVRPVGSNRFEDVDIRVVAATNVSIPEAVERGEFRQDLYYRLNVVELAIPPLRDRKGDIPLLLSAFLSEFAELQGVTPPGVAPDALRILERHPWPGNVRELRNLAHRLVVLDTAGVITVADLPPAVRDWTGLSEDVSVMSSLPYSEAREEVLAAFRASYCRQLLKETDGNVTRAASAAGVSRRTFHRWLAEQTPVSDAETG
ncbi:MAG: sigma-54-dependent transcriptional regulator [Gemmatimonadota bacterium]